VNVLIVVPWDQEFGGVASVVRNLATQLSARGHTVRFFHPGESSRPLRKTARNGFPGWEFDLKSPSVDGHPILSRIAFLLYLIPTLLRLRALLRRERIDIVNIHYPVDYFVWFALSVSLAPIRLVTSIHGGDMLLGSKEPRPLRWGVRKLLRSSHAVVAPSAGYRDEALAPLPELLSRTHVIHNAVDLEGLSAAAPGPAPDGAPYLLTVAAHNQRKGIDVLLRAFESVAPRHPGLELHLVGDGPLRPLLEAQADAGGFRSRIRFLGQRLPPEVMRLLRSCRVFVLPSRTESFGMAALEAMGCGAPVVASRVGGIPEIIEDGRHGLLVPPDDPDALAAGIGRLLDDPGLARRLGEAGAERVRAEFAAPHAGARYEALFLRLLGGAAGRSRSGRGGGG
jgi:glycosyltransferase involved in cell wall biosynthesis